MVHISATWNPNIFPYWSLLCFCFISALLPCSCGSLMSSTNMEILRHHHMKNKHYVFVVCRFLCVSFVDQVDPIYHCYIIGVLYVCGFWGMSVSNWSKTVVNCLSTGNDQTPVICCSSYCIYMFFVVWIFIPFLFVSNQNQDALPQNKTMMQPRKINNIKKYLLK